MPRSPALARVLGRTLVALDVGVLGVFAARRAVLVVAARARPRPLARLAEPPSVALLVPLRNEEVVLPRLLRALDRLEYPAGRLHVVFVDDASDDGSARVLAGWTRSRDHATVVRLAAPRGKPEALNRGLAAAPATEVVAVCDADLQPEPQALLRLVEGFGDRAVGAVAGFRRPEESRTVVARYAAVESWLHQLVTSAGKDRLGLDPPVLGFGAYRRDALDAIGWFRTDVRAEDVDSTVALARAGWRARFTRAAVADNLVASTLRDYWRQHLRWSSTLFEAAVSPPRAARTAPLPTLPRRIEHALMSAGYLDRLAFAVAVTLAAAGRAPRWVPPAYLGVVSVDAAEALRHAQLARGELLRHLLALPAFFPVDVVASAAAVVRHKAVPSAGWRGAEPRARRPGAELTGPAVPSERRLLRRRRAA